MAATDHREQLRQRRLHLQSQSAAQRQQLKDDLQSIDHRVHWLEQGVRTARSFLKRPAVMAGSAALGLLVGPRRAVRLAGQATLVVAAARRLLRFVNR